MEPVKEPNHLELIKEASREHGITDFTVFYDSSSEKGDHFLGDVTAISVRETHTNKVLNLILKSTHANKELGKKRPLLEAFQREYEIYNNILPEFLKFQVANVLSNPFTGTPKFYGGSLQHGKEAILMENLISSGYKLWKPMEPMNFEHVALVLKEYAKFHAISLSFRHKFRERFEDLTKNIKLTFLEERARKNPEHQKHLKHVILLGGKKAVSGNQKAEEAYARFEELLPDFWNNNKNHPEQEILVVGHGDCHQYNVMFNYDDKEESSKPTKACLIDWQLSSTESPIHDVSFFLFACASTEVLRRSDELFQIYHGVIAQNLKEFGCDPVEIFSYETFLRHWKKYFLHGLYRAQTVLKLTLTDPEEVSELDQSTSILDILKKDVSESSRFPQRIRDLFEVVGENWL